MEIDFEKYFNEKNIKSVEREMQKYIPQLYAQAEVFNNYKEIIKIYDCMNSFENKQIMKHLMKYCDLKDKNTLYLNWLAYNIGLQNCIYLLMKEYV